MRKENRSIWKRRLSVIGCGFFWSALIILLLYPPLIRYGRKQEALAVLGEAKNVEITLRMLSISYYGREIPLFSPQEANGITEQVASEIKEMSMENGQLILLAWSNEEMRPLAFLYTDGAYTVRFDYDLIGKESSWEVYRSQKTLEFGK